MSKVHFIHIPKNGGMAIRRSDVLKPLITISHKQFHISKEYSDNVLATMQKYKQHHGYQHARWRDLNESVRNGRSFAIVRNPWAKVVSRYTFAMTTNSREEGYTFEQFIEERHEWANVPYFWHRAIKGWYQQKDHVVDENGKLRADIMRTEHLNDDINEYFGKVIHLPLRNVSNGNKTKENTIINRRDYRDFYTPETYDIITDWYADDIEFFGFTFDGPATKNVGKLK